MGDKIMTDDERKLLAYVAIKQAEMDAFLKSLAPILIQLAASRDEKKTDQTAAVALQAMKPLIEPQLRSSIQFLQALNPHMSPLFAQLGSASSANAAKGVRDYFEIR
jgi:hypothetical protein